MSSREYGVLLTKFTRKLAFSGIDEFVLESATLSAAGDENTGIMAIQQALNTGSISTGVTNGQLEDSNARNDMLRLGAPYFVVSTALKEEVCVQLCRTLKESPIVTEGKKGAAQALLVEKVLGDQHGSSICYNLLRMGPKASSHLFNSFDKIKVDDIATIVSSTLGGSCVLQRFILSAVAKDAMSGNQNRPNPNVATPSPTDAPAKGAAQTAPTTSTLLRFVRRLEMNLGYMASGKFAGFVIECAYEQSNVEGKEVIIKGLIPVYTALFGGESRNQQNAKRDNGWPTSNATLNKDGLRVAAPRNVVKTQPAVAKTVSIALPLQLEGQGTTIAKKVLVKCCVDQYVHRKADWLKLAEKQASVKMAMQRILATESQF